MKIIKYLEQLKEEHKNNITIRKNGTLLLAPGKIPKSRFMLFAPLSDEIIQKFVVDNYKGMFPEELIEFYKYSNGAQLYCVKKNFSKCSIASTMLCVFGLPMTQPYGRLQDMEEPFDIRIEDLSRPDELPNSWLKLGTYYKPDVSRRRRDIYIDTITKKVYSCYDREKSIEEKWNSLDECLCSIFDSLRDFPLEIDIKE